MSEEWRDVAGYEGRYQVSSMGRVKSLARTYIGKSGGEYPIKERVLKPCDDGRGYLFVSLRDGGKRKHFKVHRLVCEAFHENTENKPCVNHIDENKTNNQAANLEWCTVKENNNYGTRNKRVGEGVAKALSKRVGQYALDGELIKIWSSTMEVHRQTGFSTGNISQAARGKYKQAYGFIWKYVERKEKITNENN